MEEERLREQEFRRREKEKQEKHKKMLIEKQEKDRIAQKKEKEKRERERKLNNKTTVWGTPTVRYIKKENRSIWGSKSNEIANPTKFSQQKEKEKSEEQDAGTDQKGPDLRTQQLSTTSKSKRAKAKAKAKAKALAEEVDGAPIDLGKYDVLDARSVAALYIYSFFSSFILVLPFYLPQDY